MPQHTRETGTRARTTLSKVPEVTAYFWIIKVLCTTVGETAADYLNVSVNLGLTGTSIATGVLLAILLMLQFGRDRYVPAVYWSAVTVISVFGTLVTDNLTDALGVPLEVSTIVFGVLLGVTFALWYRSEKTLSIHSIVTTRREGYYWAAILFTFALGTAVGDLMAQALGLGYAVTGLIVAFVVVLVAVAWRIGMHPVLAFWVIYILTRPLGASLGDYLSQSRSEGGLGLGATLTSVLFLAAIVAVVAFLSFTRADRITTADRSGGDEVHRGGRRQTVAVVLVLLAAGVIGYTVQSNSLRTAQAVAIPPAAAPAGGSAPQAASSASPLGDLSSFRTITQNTLDLLNAGDQSGATTRITDLETEWDNAQARLKARDSAAWTEVDGKIDTVLRELRATSPNPATEKAALNDLLVSLG